MHEKRAYCVYAGIIFLSAFLLFAIQPIAGKRLLPLFGGSSAVWATSLLFFTALLFCGYLYVYVLTRLPARTQSIVHALVVGAAALVTAAAWYFGTLHAFGTTPYIEVLSALFTLVGAPYFVLATTGPLLQYWWGLSSAREPYKLYALSNAGSLIALASYPLLVEPLTSLHVQEDVWFALFLLFAAAMAALSLSHSNEMPRAPLGISDTSSTWKGYLVWLGLAALPAFLLVATTAQITQVIAPVPLLWVVPLMLYLLTFIFAFAGRSGGKFAPLLLLIASVIAYALTPAAYHLILWQLLSYLALLFFCGLACHGRLYHMRPHTSQLPLFYLLLSLGGTLGTLAAGVVAPLVFSDFWEFPVGIALCAIVAVAILPAQLFPRFARGRVLTFAKGVGCCAAIIALSLFLTKDSGFTSIVSRNFYGVTKVTFLGLMTVLTHGNTIHGIQPSEHANEFLPSLYYTPGSGVGRGTVFERKTQKEPLRIGVIGLGTAALAAYCQKGDAFVFYEIDPHVEQIAHEYFSYLSHCPGSEVREGDARILLQKEHDEKKLGGYDLIAVDAFSDDKVPVHLLTLQALQLYASHLHNDKSIIAVHVSNKYLELAPVVLRLAAEMRMNALVVNDTGASNFTGGWTRWVLLAKDPDVFKSVVFANSNNAPTLTRAPLWTDDYASLLPVLSLPL